LLRGISKLVIATFVFSCGGLGCSCSQPDVKAAMKAAHSVFIGQVVRIKWIDHYGDPLFGERRTIVTFRVSGVYKGHVGSTIVLHTQENRSSCAGFNFLEGHEYIVYSYSYEPNKWTTDKWRSPSVLEKPQKRFLGTSICSRTNEIINAGQDLKELGQPRPPL